jgi:hypothetical protein
MTDTTEGERPNATRYFYSDPLAAAWMSKHFGMRITDANGVAESIEDMCTTAWLLDESEALWYLHSDSVQLLDPQNGDLVQHRGMIGVYDACGQIVIVSEAVETHCYNIRTDDYRIILRDGKPFHWPQSE